MTPSSERSSDGAANLNVLNVVALTLRYVIPWLGVCVALYLFAGIVAAALGSSSISNAWVQLMSNVSRTRGFAFVFGFLGVLYGIQQRNLRPASVTRLRARLTALEHAPEAKSGARPL